MLNYRLAMRNTYGIHYSYPFYAPEGGQNLYVIVPTANPTKFENFHQQADETETHFAEEILPDFRCKICSETIPNYSELKIHEETHKNSEVSLSESNSQENHPLQSPVHYLLQPELPVCRNDTAISTNTTFQASVANEDKTINVEFKEKYQTEIRPRLLPSKSNNLTSLRRKGDPVRIEQKPSPVKQIKNAHVATSKLPRILTLQVLGKGSALKPAQKSLSNVSGSYETSTGDVLKFSKTSDNQNQTTAFTASALSDGNYEETLRKPKNETCNLLSSLYVGLKDWVLPITGESKKVGELCKSNSSVGSLHEAVDEFDICESVSRSQTKNSAEITETNAEVRAGDEMLNVSTDRMPTRIIPAQTMDNERIAILKSDSKIKDQAVTDFENSEVRFAQSNTHGSELLDKFSPAQPADEHSVSQPTPKPFDVMIDAKSSTDPKQHTNADLGIRISNEARSKPILLRLSTSSVKPEVCLPILEKSEDSGSHFRCLPCAEVLKSSCNPNEHTCNLRGTDDVVCVMCKSKFSGISSLRKHILMFHCKDRNRRQCPHCSYRCFQTSDLEKHIARRHTRDFKFKCSWCIKGFATPKELLNHIKRKHSNAVSDLVAS